MNPSDSLLTVHGVSDLLIALSYFFIPVQISICLNTTRNKVKVLAIVQITFVLFIICCGFTHLLSFLFARPPSSSIETLTKVITAFVSLCSTIVLQLFAREIRSLVNKAAVLESTISASEDRVDELIKENAELAQARSQILASITHEFRNPLQSILGFSSLLQRSSLNPKQGQMVQDIMRCGNSLLTLVNDIVKISRITADNFSLAHELFSPVEECQTVLRLASVNTKPGVTLRYRLISSVQKRIWGDGLRFNQVLTNLVSNSAKFTAKGSISITVSMTTNSDGLDKLLAQHLPDTMKKSKRKSSPAVNQRGSSNGNASGEDVRMSLLGHGRWLVVVVADTGVGIPNEGQKRLFRHFSQAHSSRKFGGSGLGLVISKTIVEKMRGRMNFCSIEGKGSAFGFTIPVGEVHSEAYPLISWTKIMTSNPYKKDAGTGGPAALAREVALEKNGRESCETFRFEGHVLVVDDNGMNRSILERFLKQLNVRKVSTADSGEKAVEFSKRSSVDVVIMDAIMPGMDGNQACLMIKKFSPSTLVFAYTGLSDVLDLQPNMYDGQLPKPCLKADVHDLLENAATRRNLPSPV